MNIVLDTQTMLILYLGEKGARKVQGLLKEVLDGKIGGYMSVVTLTELYYILARKGNKLAERKERDLRSYGVQMVTVEDDSLWREAAVLRAKHGLSLADAFAATTAKMLNATLVTGRKGDFEGIDGIKVERVG